MTLKRAIVVVALLVAMGLTLVWQHGLSVRYGYRLSEVAAQREKLQRENAMIYAQVQSMVGAGELAVQIDRHELPLVGWRHGDPGITDVAVRD